MPIYIIDKNEQSFNERNAYGGAYLDALCHFLERTIDPFKKKP